LNRQEFVPKDFGTKQLLRANDQIIMPDGTQGLVQKVYRSVQTGEVQGCSVAWNTEYKGERFTLFLSITSIKRSTDRAILWFVH